MNRKIFLIVNVGYGGASAERPTVLSGDADSALARASSEFEKLTADELGELIDNEKFDFDNASCDHYHYHYFKRRALARRAKAALEANDPHVWGGNLRIIEVGEFDRNTRAVSSWKIVRFISLDDGKTWDSGVVSHSGIATRNEARTQRDDWFSARVRERPCGGELGVKWKLVVTPVYADGV